MNNLGIWIEFYLILTSAFYSIGMYKRWTNHQPGTGYFLDPTLDAVKAGLEVTSYCPAPTTRYSLLTTDTYVYNTVKQRKQLAYTLNNHRVVRSNVKCSTHLCCDTGHQRGGQEEERGDFIDKKLSYRKPTSAIEIIIKVHRETKIKLRIATTRSDNLLVR